MDKVQSLFIWLIHTFTVHLKPSSGFELLLQWNLSSAWYPPGPCVSWIPPASLTHLPLRPPLKHPGQLPISPSMLQGLGPCSPSQKGSAVPFPQFPQTSQVTPPPRLSAVLTFLPAFIINYIHLPFLQGPLKQKSYQFLSSHNGTWQMIGP